MSVQAVRLTSGMANAGPWTAACGDVEIATERVGVG
jgi:hypothetical protein